MILRTTRVRLTITRSLDGIDAIYEMCPDSHGEVNGESDA